MNNAYIYWNGFQTYAEFHADLFPDTFCGEPSMSVSQWKKGQNIAVSQI